MEKRSDKGRGERGDQAIAPRKKAKEGELGRIQLIRGGVKRLLEETLETDPKTLSPSLSSHKDLMPLSLFTSVCSCFPQVSLPPTPQLQLRRSDLPLMVIAAAAPPARRES